MTSCSVQQKIWNKPNVLWNSAGTVSKTVSNVPMATYSTITFTYPTFLNTGTTAKGCDLVFYLYGQAENANKWPADFTYTPILCDSVTTTPRMCSFTMFTAFKVSMKADVIANYFYYNDWSSG